MPAISIYGNEARDTQASLDQKQRLQLLFLEGVASGEPLMKKVGAVHHRALCATVDNLRVACQPKLTSVASVSEGW